MATIKLVENPTRRRVAANPKRRRKARRNPSPVVKTASNPARKRRRRRNPTATTVVKTASNPRRRVKRRRRNGVIAARRRVSNGLLGNSKETAKAVGALLGGLAVTKVAGGLLSPTAARLLASVGLGNYAEPLVQAGLAVTFNRWAGRQVAGNEGAKFAMIGGLAMATMSIVQQLIPQTSVYNPFAQANMTPIVLNQPSIIDAATAQQIAAQTQMQNAAKIGRAGMGYRRANILAPRY